MVHVVIFIEIHLPLFVFMVGLRFSRDFLANAEADDPGEDVSVCSLPSVDDFRIEFGDFFSLDGERANIELRRELFAEDFGSFSSSPKKVVCKMATEIHQ